MIKEDNIKEETHSQQDPSDNKSFKREHYINDPYSNHNFRVDFYININN